MPLTKVASFLMLAHITLTFEGVKYQAADRVFLLPIVYSNSPLWLPLTIAATLEALFHFNRNSSHFIFIGTKITIISIVYNFLKPLLKN